ncbi:TIGR02281 family clan AA aspartic protease [Roseateles saccharophilus]|uniref:Aspartyl protease family protein n=1 Tax=Roseateles saccharophilus TaxID=304 RepID=A0A4R3VA42_ROSSA|nr:retropepsin-like aspartic protease [Roseateles saccharophilus]MDG0832591.1 TIGR02281 family clan AA aspartic protease [Roseateles saccharophilus]TCV00329.1 aspartyl protease family protein [Roseateles saccharophilus]
MHRLAPLALLLALALLGRAEAQPLPPSQVQLNGTLGTRAALLLIDGEPRTVEVGATVNGVKLIALEDGRAVVEYGGRRQSLTLGAAPGRVVSQNAVTPRQIVLSAGPGGHFTTMGAINGHATNFLVDTGATAVAIGQPEADRLGLRYLNGRHVITQTANGLAPAYQIQLASLRIGDVEVRNVEAIVIPGLLGYVLLGNSFLNRFQMRRENDVMTLDLRY